MEEGAGCDGDLGREGCVVGNGEVAEFRFEIWCREEILELGERLK